MPQVAKKIRISKKPALAIEYLMLHLKSFQEQ
jgi:hypothetical protein